MRRSLPFTPAFLVFLAFVVIAGCAHRPPVQNVLLPPRIDLTQHEVIGVVDFASDLRGDVASQATRRFEELARRDQGLVRMVDLGPDRQALKSLGQKDWSPASFKSAGGEHDVQTLFTGELQISHIKPDVSLAGSLRAGQVTAQVDATLTVRLTETSTGASLWNRSARATRSVGHLSAAKGEGYAFGARDGDEAYAELIDTLVEQVTRDFRATWVRQ